MGVVDSYQRVVGGTGGGCYLLVCIFLFLFLLLSFGLSCPIPFIK